MTDSTKGVCERHGVVCVVRVGGLHHPLKEPTRPCPWCDGTGRYATAAHLDRETWVDCTMCDGTGRAR